MTEKDDGVDYDDDIGNPVFGSSQKDQTSSFPDLKSGVFQQLLENMPSVLIKTANSDEELDTFFRMEFPLIEGMLHIDGTHGIVKNRFPLDVFAITDKTGQLFPISFMITSFETEYDFDQFYSGLI